MATWHNFLVCCAFFQVDTWNSVIGKCRKKRLKDVTTKEAN